MIKYYNQTQNDLRLFYDKMILLHFIIDKSLFQTAKWKVEFEETSWHTIYWNAFEKMYNEYKQDNIELKFQSKQSDRQNQDQILNDILNDDVIAQTSSKKNEFISYRK